MLIVTLTGNTGKDAEHKTTQGGSELCAFSVAAEVGYGDNKQTHWVNVTKWGKGSEGLARILRKGSKVSVSGELSTREYEGKTYLQCRADHVAIQGTPNGGQSTGGAEPADMSGGHDDLSDDIPFLTSDSVF